MRFDSKISALEERVDLDTMTMDELHGILTAYEMRIEQDNLVTKEETFKASKKTKKRNKKQPKSVHKQEPKSDSNNNDDSEDDEEIANFVRRLKPGIKKYKGKIPLIFFNCDGIGHFSNKCPHKKKKRNEEDEAKRKQIHKGKRYKNKISRKVSAPRKTVPRQTKMKSATMIHKEYYLW
jgi:hypothetical protein